MASSRNVGKSAAEVEWIQYISKQVDLLMEAVSMGHLKQVQDILSFRFSKQTFANLAPTLMHQAANNKHCSVMEFLLDKGATLNCQNAQGMSPLHIVSHKGDVQSVRMLLARGANVNATDYDNRTPLYLAAYDGHQDCLDAILASEKVDMHISRKGGWTPLHEACRFGYLECAERLLKAGADLMAVTTDSQWTPGHMAAANGHLPCLKFIIRHGMSVDTKGGPNRSSTMLHEACHFGHSTCVEFLLSSGANAMLYDDKEIPIHTVCRLGHAECLKVLVDHYQRINRADIIDSFTDVDLKESVPSYLNPLHMATIYDHNDCVEILLQCGAKHLPTGSGHYPLMLAAVKMNIECLRTLLSSDDVVEHSSNSLGFNALHYLCNKTYRTTDKAVACVCLLLNWGVNINDSVENVVDTCLHMAAKNGAVGMVRFLINSGADPRLCESLDGYLLNNPNVQECKCVVEEALFEPSSLLILCRLKMRSVLGRGQIHNIYKLDLPRKLQDYLFHGHYVANGLCKPLWQ